MIRAALWAACGVLSGLAIGMALVVLLPPAAGMRSFTVLSGSMEPALSAGDVVVDERIEPLAARPGDVVTFADPTRRGRLLTHRVRSVRARGGRAELVTKGDANSAVERWSVPLDGRIGRVRMTVPGAGYALSWAGGRWGRLLLIAVPAVLLAAMELRSIWRPRRDDEPAAEASGAAAA